MLLSTGSAGGGGGSSVFVAHHYVETQQDGVNFKTTSMLTGKILFESTLYCYEDVEAPNTVGRTRTIPYELKFNRERRLASPKKSIFRPIENSLLSWSFNSSHML